MKSLLIIPLFIATIVSADTFEFIQSPPTEAEIHFNNDSDNYIEFFLGDKRVGVLRERDGHLELKGRMDRMLKCLRKIRESQRDRNSNISWGRNEP